FVIVSILGKQFKTPVCKRNLDPIYEKDATFDFPIYASLVHKLDTLDFTVWDEDRIRNDYLGGYALPVGKWFKGTAFAFDDPNNEPLSAGLISSRPTTTARGTMRIKVGFVHPPNSKGPPDFGKTYNILMNPVSAPPVSDKGRVGIVMLEICGAENLPEWPNMTYTDWDMDPFVEVSIEEVQRTRVIRHSRNPVWDEQLFFHVHEHDLALPIKLKIFDRDKISRNDYVGEARKNIAELVVKTPKKDPNAGFDHVDFPKFNLPLTTNPKRVYTCTPTITFCASYQSYDALRK
ncbi:C2 domain-containing protein, partial [Lactarius psammicola]